jgi:tetratricopeptide (TPR) repeat protein
MPDTEHFVARKAELARLHAMLELALTGKGQVCFVAGEAGTGKTALSEAFQIEAQARHADLVIAGGACDAQVGDSSPYAPFHEVLAALTDGVAGRAVAPKVKLENSARVLKTVRLIAEALAKFGPDLVGVFIPGTPFLGKMAEFVLDQTGLRDKFKKRIGAKEAAHPLLASGSLSQDQIIEQFVNVLRDLAARMPLLIVLDDLHWADTSSIDLVFRLIRRLADSRLFILCALRPHDLRAASVDTPHPLEKVINEARRLRGDIWLDLSEVSERNGREFIDALIDAEPNRLGQVFRQNLFAHTEGHPLFTVELLRDFQDRGVLVLDQDEAWTLAGPVDWGAIPARVEGVVASRLSGLTKDQREILEIAAAEGQEFTAELIARVESRDGRDIVRQLSGQLQNPLQLVRGLDTRRIGAQRLSRYRFGHQLVQKYLNDELDEVQRSYLHESVGLGLEALYGAEAPSIASQLARHFELGGIPDKARFYLATAADQAAAAYANDTAIDFYTRALGLTPVSAASDRIALLSGRERVYHVLGQRDLQQADLDALQELAMGPEQSRLRTDLLIRRASVAFEMGDFGAAIDAATAAVSVTDGSRDRADVEARFAAVLLRARAHFQRGEADACRADIDAALALSRAEDLPFQAAKALEQQGVLRWSVGDFSGAKTVLEKALAVYRSAGDLRAECSVLNNLGIVAMDQRDFARAGQFYEQGRAIAMRMGQRVSEAYLLANQGNAGYDSGDFGLARRCAERALEIALDSSERHLQAVCLGNQAETLAEIGDYATARSLAERALALATEIGFRRGMCAWRSLLSWILLSSGDAAGALAHADAGVDLASERALRSRLGGLRMRQARALTALGRYAEALAAGETARTLSSEFGSPALAAQADAARAEALLARNLPGDIALALRLALPEAEILDHSDAGGAPLEYPLWTNLVLIRTLSAAGDPRARDAVRAALEALKARAQRITDSSMRRGFVDDVSEHAAIQRLFAELAGKSV